jgi:hypothetical protein
LWLNAGGLDRTPEKERPPSEARGSMRDRIEWIPDKERPPLEACGSMRVGWTGHPRKSDPPRRLVARCGIGLNGSPTKSGPRWRFVAHCQRHEERSLGAERGTGGVEGGEKADVSRRLAKEGRFRSGAVRPRTERSVLLPAHSFGLKQTPTGSHVDMSDNRVC